MNLIAICLQRRNPHDFSSYATIGVDICGQMDFHEICMLKFPKYKSTDFGIAWFFHHEVNLFLSLVECLHNFCLAFQQQNIRSLFILPPSSGQIPANKQMLACKPVSQLIC